jgi:uncharacterized membrane protein YjdF
MVVEVNLRSQSIDILLEIFVVGGGYTLKRASEEWMSLMFMPWKRELTSHNSFLSIFFIALFPLH